MPRIEPTRIPPQRNVPAVTKNTTPASLAASNRPPSAGPTKLPRLSIVLRATFAAVSSSGVRASSGSAADSAGRNAVPRIEVIPASA